MQASASGTGSEDPYKVMKTVLLEDVPLVSASNIARPTLTSLTAAGAGPVAQR